MRHTYVEIAVVDLVGICEASGMEAESTESLAERAAQAVERAILTGRFPPGARLRIAEISEQFEIGATPVREGLSRLITKGLVRIAGSRGFQVAPVSRADLEDLVAARIAIEVEALRLAIAKGDARWEGQILSCLHQMQRQLDLAPEGLAEMTDVFDAVHREFHAALIAACGSQRLRDLAALLYDQGLRYRRLMVLRVRLRRPLVPAEFLAEHRHIAELVLARDAVRAEAALRAHFSRTLEDMPADA